jgi:lactate permease
MLFGRLQLDTAALMGISPSILVCSMTVGASIGSISSPFKIAIATPLCGAEGHEGEVLRKTIPLGIAVSLGIGLFTMLWLRF